jgi:formate hydrogenlyase subunit 3/multisubunit Na+/H+ antiporter MnhD subunit
VLYDPVFYVLSGLVLYFFASAALVPFVAEQKGRSAFGWAFIAFFFTPLFALIALAAVSDKLGPVAVEAPEADAVPEYKWRKP